MQVKASELESNKLYGLLTAIVSPRPIAWVGSKSVEGVINLAPFSFYNVASVNPPVISIGILNRPDGTQKDSLINIESTKDFSISIVSHDHAKVMAVSSGDFPNTLNEFTETGLVEQPCRYVDAVCVQSANAVLECQLREVVRFENEGQPVGGNLVLADVIGIHIAEAILDGDRIDVSQIDTIGRFAGPYYTSTRSPFTID